MTITDFATLGIVGCLLILVALVEDWGTPMLQRAAQRSYDRKWSSGYPTYPHDDADE